MKPLDRNGSSKATTEQADTFNRGRLIDKIESIEKDRSRLYKGNEELREKVKEASTIIQQERSKGQKLFDQLTYAAAQFKTLRGKLGNMTAQRNRAHRALKATMDKLGKANQDITNIQEGHDKELADLAKDYREMSPEQRRFLPAKLRYRLDQYEKDYKE